MKRILLSLLTLCLAVTSYAQVTWTGDGDNINWSDAANWDTTAVPTANDDVIIPTGFSVTLNVVGDVQSLDIQGNSTFLMTNNLTFVTATLGANAIMNWEDSSLSGTGTFTNLGTINKTGTGVSSIGLNANDDVTLVNEGVFNMTSAGDLWIKQGRLNNVASGIFDMQADGGDVSWSGGTVHIFNNEGLIKRSTSTGNANFYLELNNTGTIAIESGSLTFLESGTTKNLSDGTTINISNDAALIWNGLVNLSGTLIGTVDGNLLITSNFMVEESVTATFDFGGASNVNWEDSSFLGKGTLVNKSIINKTGTGVSSIGLNADNEVTLVNEGIFNMTSSGDFWIRQGIFNNTETGVFDMQVDGGDVSWSGGAVHIFNNEGLIKRSTSTGNVNFYPELNNTGTIAVESGSITFLESSGTRKNLNDGTTINIDSGAALIWNGTVNLSGILTGTVDGSLTITNNFTVAESVTATFDFEGASNVNWEDSSFFGLGTLINKSTINKTGTGVSSIGLNADDDVTLVNEGIFNITSTGDFWIKQGQFNNAETGIFDMQADGGDVSWSGGTVHIFNNEGLIKRSTSTGNTIFYPELNNTGTIAVESGSITFLESSGTRKNLNDGTTINIDSGAALIWNGTVNLSGILTGTVDGSLTITNNFTVAESVTATFDFEGASNVNWEDSSFFGLGTLINKSTINKTGTGVSSIGLNADDDVTLVNEGVFNMTSTGDLWIKQGRLNNVASGVFDMQADGGDVSWSGGSVHIFNNAGLLKTTYDNSAIFYPTLNNSGIIRVESGELRLLTSSGTTFTNEETGRMEGSGILDASGTTYTNNGITAPGNSPGTLTFQNNYETETTAVFEVELNGLTPDTEHDVLAIQGNANFNGSVNVLMGFEAEVGNTFVVANTTGTITDKNLTSPFEVDYDGKRYTFEVSYPDDNKVVLSITNKLDILPPNVITQNITVQLDANGTANITTAQIDNGSTDNCTPTNELQFSLDVSSFDCSNLGDNTVELTVIDNDNNSASATAIVTVEDNIAPTAIGQNITVELDASGMASITTADIDNGSSDNCTITSMSLSKTDFSCDDLEIGLASRNTDVDVTLTVTDQSGNSNTTTVIVTVQDNIAPTVITQNVTVQLNADGDATVSVSDVNNGSSDNCTLDGLNLDIASFTCADLGDNIVTLTATDQSGNTASDTAVVTVEDMITPTVITQDITVQLDANGSVSISASAIDNGSTDNCGVPNLGMDITTFTCNDLGDNTVTLTVTDSSGNSASETAVVTVEDTIAPTLSCPEDLTVDVEGNYTLPDYIDLGDAVASDNCSFSVVQSPAPGTELADGDHEISLTLTDGANNTTDCSFMLTVNDTSLSLIDSVLNDVALVLYPNPATHTITLKNTSSHTLLSATIVDVKGSIVNTINLKGTQTNTDIAIDNLANGMYFIQIKASHTTVVKRFIKQ